MSIWGNAITLGGSGGSGPSASDAILTVTVPTGSTITMTKGALSLTPTMWVQAADASMDCALFVIAPAQFDSVNPWTVTATLGTDTASDTVTIDSNEQYDVELSYVLYLFRHGYGQVTPLTLTKQSNATISSDAEYIYVGPSGGGNYTVWALSSTDVIDCSKYSTMVIQKTFSWTSSVSNLRRYGISSSRAAGGEINTWKVYADWGTSTSEVTLSLDISSYNDSAYISVAGQAYGTISNIYLLP